MYNTCLLHILYIYVFPELGSRHLFFSHHDKRQRQNAKNVAPSESKCTVVDTISSDNATDNNFLGLNSDCHDSVYKNFFLFITSRESVRCESVERCEDSGLPALVRDHPIRQVYHHTV